MPQAGTEAVIAGLGEPPVGRLVGSNPTEPGSGIEPCAWQASVRHRQQVVAGGDPGAAVHHGLRRIPPVVLERVGRTT